MTSPMSVTKAVEMGNEYGERLLRILAIVNARLDVKPEWSAGEIETLRAITAAIAGVL